MSIHSSFWSEYRTNGGDITSGMMLDVTLWEATGKYPFMFHEDKKDVAEVLQTIRDSEAWVKAFEEKHLSRLQQIAESPDNYRYDTDTHKVLTMSTCGRFLVSIYEKKSPGAWVTLIGEDPPRYLNLQGLAANHSELQALLSLELDPNQWTVSNSMGIR